MYQSLVSQMTKDSLFGLTKILLRNVGKNKWLHAKSCIKKTVQHIIEKASSVEIVESVIPLNIIPSTDRPKRWYDFIICKDISVNYVFTDIQMLKIDKIKLGM